MARPRSTMPPPPEGVEPPTAAPISNSPGPVPTAVVYSFQAVSDASRADIPMEGYRVAVETLSAKAGWVDVPVEKVRVVYYRETE